MQCSSGRLVPSDHTCSRRFPIVGSSPDGVSSLCSRVGCLPSHRIKSALPLYLLSLGYVMPPILVYLVVMHRGIVLQQSCPSTALFLSLVLAIVSLALFPWLSTCMVLRPLSRLVLETVFGNVLGSRCADGSGLSIE